MVHRDNAADVGHTTDLDFNYWLYHSYCALHWALLFATVILHDDMPRLALFGRAF